MFTDPLSVTYSGSAKSLPRVRASSEGATYRTADGEFEVIISDLPPIVAGREFRLISLGRVLPDLTPTDVFDTYREIKNTFGYFYQFDSTRAGLSSDIGNIRTALDSFVTSTYQGRIISGEK